VQNFYHLKKPLLAAKKRMDATAKPFSTLYPGKIRCKKTANASHKEKRIVRTSSSSCRAQTHEQQGQQSSSAVTSFWFKSLALEAGGMWQAQIVHGPIHGCIIRQDTRRWVRLDRFLVPILQVVTLCTSSLHLSLKR